MSALRGVNLGGWLVLERWMTPSVFEGTSARDEYTFMQTDGARGKLRQHQKSFITEADFRWLHENGIEAVRIPVGYWILDGDDPFVSSIGKLDWAFAMAQKYELEVLISLHGAQGSQNGYDHSGRIGDARWYTDAAFRHDTVRTLVALSKRYRDHPRFWGIELLNEPLPGVLQVKLRTFYRDAYRVLKEILLPTTRIVFHDAFRPRMMVAALIDDDSRPVMMDIHWYHFGFWARKWMSKGQYYYFVRWHGRLIRRLQRWQGVIIGEWSGALAWEMLNRYPEDARHQVELDHVRTQLEVYRYADAWFYWSYKTEFGGTWSLRSLIEDDGLSLKQQG